MTSYNRKKVTFSNQVSSICGEKRDPNKCGNEKKVGSIPPTLKQSKKLADPAGKQYIELHDEGTPGLPYSARLRCGHTYWKLHGQECLVTIGSSYVALVSINSTPELNEANDFIVARTVLLKNLKTEEILLDQMQEEMADLESSIRTQLLELASESSDHSIKARCMLDLLRIAEKHSYEIDFDFCKDLRSSTLIHRTRLKVAFVTFSATRNALRNRDQFQLVDIPAKERNSSNGFLQESLNAAFEQHKHSLRSVRSDQIRKKVDNLERFCCILLGPTDMSALCDLECVFKDFKFGAEVPVILNSFFKSIENINLTDFSQSFPAINCIYNPVCKSMFEIASCSEKILDLQVCYTKNKWKMALIQKNTTHSSLYRCFATQLHMLLTFANHFEPGKSTAWHSYPYTFRMDHFNSLDMPRNEQQLWLYLVDSTMFSIFEGDLERIRQFSDILETFRECFILKDTEEQLCEMLRRMTHDTLEFVALTEQKSTLKHTTMCKEILRKQLNLVQYIKDDNSNRINEFCHYISVLNSFWKILFLPQLSDKFKDAYLTHRIGEVQEVSLDVAYHALSKKVDHMAIVDFLEQYNNLFADLEDFPFEWQVRFKNERMKNALLEANIISTTHNQLYGTKFECFTVSRHHYEIFVTICAEESIPKHFQLETVSELLNYTVRLLQKHRWKRGGKLLTNVYQLQIAELMVIAIRCSLLHLRDQSSYIDFERFYEVVIKQFSCIENESVSLEHFTKRAADIIDFFKYVDQQNTEEVEKLLISLTTTPLKQLKKLTSYDKDQHIELRNPDAVGLPYSAKFRYRNSYWKLHGAEGLITVGTSYVAKVTVASIEELNDESDFDTAQRILLSHVKVQKVLMPQQNGASFLQTECQELAKQCGTRYKTTHHEMNRIVDSQSWLQLITLYNTTIAEQNQNHRSTSSYHPEASVSRQNKHQTYDRKTVEEIRGNIFGWKLKQRGKLTDESEKQYIKLRNTKSKGAPYAAKFDHEGSTWKLHGEECLITIGTSYVAQVSIESIAELNESCDFNSAKTILLKRVEVKKVILDNLQEATANALELLKSELFRLGDESATSSQSAKCLLELWRLGEKHRFMITNDFVKEVCSNSNVHSEKFKAAMNMYMENNNKLEKRNFILKGLKRIQNMINKNNIFKQTLEAVYIRYKKYLLNFCSAEIANKLSNLELRCFMLLREDDVKLFSDLECALNQTMFGTVLPQIIDNFVKRIRALQQADYCQSLPLTNLIYFHVCKGLVEMENRVRLDVVARNIVEYRNGKWNMVPVSENHITSAPSKCFVKQLEMLVKFANYFEPGKPSARENFPYAFQITQFQQANNLRSEYHVWLCLVDSTMAYIFQEDFDRIQEYSAVTDMFEKCLSSKDLSTESHESVRVVTHNTLELVAQIEESGYGLNEVNRMILERQTRVMSQAFFNGKLAFTQYRDVTDVFKDFWERFNDVLPSLSSKVVCNYLRQQIDRLKPKLMEVISCILDKKLHSDDITKFFRAYNDFIMDFKELNFEWYVRFPDGPLKKKLITRYIMSIVDNDLKNTFNECCEVKKGMADKFVELLPQNIAPKHYQIEIMCTFLDYIIGLTQKSKWKYTNVLTEEDQLNATILLINAIRSSLMYLKEQPMYVDFEKYYEETIKPFGNVVEDSDSMESFTKRIELVKESFWYIRNQNSIGIDKALELCKQQNDNFNKEYLKAAFALYNEQFEKHLSDTCKLGNDEKIQKIVQDTRDKVHPMLCSEWTVEFRQTTIPKILGGLGAVWAIMVSRDVASSGNYLKPHPIQILSVLRLLGIDRETTGVENHLAQILTGQGKSLTLGLVAALLALFGHDVVVVCYSEYLAVRDLDDFRGFYMKFSISPQILYATFAKMASYHGVLLYRRALHHLETCLGIPHSYFTPMENTGDVTKTVLLIDEVDVFFADTFYGNTVDFIYHFHIPGLGLIQQRIWTLLQENYFDVKGEINRFIASSDHPDITSFRSIMHRPGSYTLLNFGAELYKTKHTNESLFQDHLKRMIKVAKEVHNYPKDRTLDILRIDSSGRIAMKNVFGKFVTTSTDDYHNSFTYFKLRQNNFNENVDGFLNFGYLKLDCASFSYSKLPEIYPLILGVTGTLTGLSPYEKNAVQKHYKINRNSIMPSYFGGSNLFFSPNEHFHCVEDENSWRNMIFTRVNAVINAQRSVIVFFDNEIKINHFKKHFENRLDRLNEITVNTESNIRERYIAEAGLTRTITLATREMGRGVDYKSSLLVEKNGGIHIIQTFFSLDDKEETQIKGRTARKDNRGSYELIVCRPHLEELKLINPILDDHNTRVLMILNLFVPDAISYSSLDQSRKRITANASNDKVKKLEMANQKHEDSIQFLNNI